MPTPALPTALNTFSRIGPPSNRQFTHCQSKVEGYDLGNLDEFSLSSGKSVISTAVHFGDATPPSTNPTTPTADTDAKAKKAAKTRKHLKTGLIIGGVGALGGAAALFLLTFYAPWIALTLGTAGLAALITGIALKSKKPATSPAATTPNPVPNPGNPPPKPEDLPIPPTLGGNPPTGINPPLGAHQADKIADKIKAITPQQKLSLLQTLNYIVEDLDLRELSRNRLILKNRPTRVVGWKTRTSKEISLPEVTPHQNPPMRFIMALPSTSYMEYQKPDHSDGARAYYELPLSVLPLEDGKSGSQQLAEWSVHKNTNEDLLFFEVNFGPLISATEMKQDQFSTLTKALDQVKTHYTDKATVNTTKEKGKLNIRIPSPFEAETMAQNVLYRVLSEKTSCNLLEIEKEDGTKQWVLPHGLENAEVKLIDKPEPPATS